MLHDGPSDRSTIAEDRLQARDIGGLELEDLGGVPNVQQSNEGEHKQVDFVHCAADSEF